jgi:protein-tyrosine-phosphatase
MPERKNYKGSQSPKYQEKLRNARLCHNDKSIIHLPGNICRSPMAEFIFKDIVRRVGLADQFEIASAATSREEIWHGKGNPVYPPAKAELAAHSGDVTDPWYSRDFTRAYRDIATGCRALLTAITTE